MVTQTSPGSGPFARMALAATVVRHETLSPGVARIHFRTDRPLGPFHPGDKVKLAVPGGAPRSYTPIHAAGTDLDILFALHGQGPTARWAARARPGDGVWTTPPLRSLRGPTSGRVWVSGDATALGLALAIAGCPDVTLDGQFELPEVDASAVVPLRLPVRVSAPGTLADTVPDDVYDHYVVSGEATAARAVVQGLRANGIDANRILLKPYWSRRGKMHRKWVTQMGGV